MFTKVLNVVLAESIRLPVEGLPSLLERKIHERLIFTNPDYEARHNRGEWIGNIPAQISCIRQKGRYYNLPRGFLDQLLDLLKKFNQPYRLVDNRSNLPAVSMEFHGELKTYQREAAENILEKDFCTLVGGHKSGKTVIAPYTIAQRSRKTLILIPKLDLLQGWITKLEAFLQISGSEIGVFASGDHQVGNRITIAHTGEAIKNYRKLADHFGYLVLDECQRCPSKVFTHLIPNFKTTYMLGLSNSVQRKDRLSRLLFYYVGDLIHTINDKDAREGRGVIQANIVARHTDFEFPYNSRADYASMLKALRRDEERLSLIIKDISHEMETGKGPLFVLSSNTDNDDTLRNELHKLGIFTETIAWNESADNDPEDESNEGQVVCEPLLDTSKPTAFFISPEVLIQCTQSLTAGVLVLAEPFYFRHSLAQAIRYLNSNTNGEDKRLKIYDYVDTRIGLLDNYFKMRSYNYGVHPDLLLTSSKH